MQKRTLFRSPAFNGIADLPCLAIESFDYHVNRKTLLDGLPRGNNQPVLFIPGFLTNDVAMNPLRRTLSELGYNSLKWGCGVNWGASHKKVQEVKDRFEQIIKDHPNQKIALVGWSLGGIYARELARHYPENVSCVITLGSPFAADSENDKHINPVLKRIYETLNPKSPLITDEKLQAQAMLPPPVPTTSVFSKTDGIVNWRASLNPDTPLSENIDITNSSSRGQGVSHTSMRLNKTAITIIADRLSAGYATTEWHPFIAEKYPNISADVDMAFSEQDKHHVSHYQSLEQTSSRLFNGPKP